MAFHSSPQSLYLGVNSLSDALPLVLGSCPSLSDALPTSIWNLYDRLVSLCLHGNNFSGTIPNSAIPNSSCDYLQPTFFLPNSAFPPPPSETMMTRFKKNQKKRGHMSGGHSRISKHRKHPGGHDYRIQDCRYSPLGRARRRLPHRWSHYGRPSHPEPHSAAGAPSPSCSPSPVFPSSPPPRAPHPRPLLPPGYPCHHHLLGHPSPPTQTPSPFATCPDAAAHRQIRWSPWVGTGKRRRETMKKKRGRKEK